MAQAIDQHNLNPGQPAAAQENGNGGNAPQTRTSDRIAAMAQAFDQHNQNPGQQTADPYAAGQAAVAQNSAQPQAPDPNGGNEAQNAAPVKKPPASVQQRQNNT